MQNEVIRFFKINFVHPFVSLIWVPNSLRACAKYFCLGAETNIPGHTKNILKPRLFPIAKCTQRKKNELQRTQFPK